jgi:hypothetical protein
MKALKVGAPGLLAACLLATVSVAAQSQPPQQSTPQQGGQPCVTATDPEYGLKAEKAVQIGGGAMYVGARSRRYLDSLKGPGGQTLTYKRQGTTATRPNGPPIDRWEVTWDGAEKPVNLFLFAYHYGEPRVPTGFTCSGFTLGNPPIDGFMASEQRRKVAVTQGATQDFAPISLDADGSSKSGILFDGFRMLARASKAATAAGKPLDPENIPQNLAQQGLVIVAYPKTCGDKPATPKTIVMGTPNGGVQSRQPYVSGDDLAKLLPGVTVPEGSMAAVMPGDSVRPNDGIRVTYDSAVCAGETGTTTFQLRGHGAKGNIMPEPTRPEGVPEPSEPVWLQAVVDLEGRLLNAQHIGGPGGIYVERSLATLRDWKADPARINGSPVVADTHVVFAFKSKD